MNNAPFRVGQRVVAVRSTPSLTKHETYTVVDLFFVPCCNKWMVCVGLVGEAGIPHKCLEHNTIHVVRFRNLVYHNPKYFAPIPPRSIEIPESLKEQAEEMKDLAETIAPMKKELV